MPNENVRNPSEPDPQKMKKLLDELIRIEKKYAFKRSGQENEKMDELRKLITENCN